MPLLSLSFPSSSSSLLHNQHCRHASNVVSGSHFATHFALKPSTLRSNRSIRFKVKMFSSSSSSSPSNGSGNAFGDVTESDSDLEVDEGEDFDSEPPVVERWDVLGLGQAMVDFSGMVDNEFLQNLGLEKSMRKVVNHEERGKVLRAMDGCSYKAAAGGSLSNSLVALARLGSRSVGGPIINVAMTGSVGGDPLGGFYRAKLRRAGVNFLSAPVKDGTTGTVIVLTTPDAQRTMLSYQGDSVLGSLGHTLPILSRHEYVHLDPPYPAGVKYMGRCCCCFSCSVGVRSPPIVF